MRDIRSGEVRDVMGPVAYMLTENEILWKKILPPGVDELLKYGTSSFFVVYVMPFVINQFVII